MAKGLFQALGSPWQRFGLGIQGLKVIVRDEVDKTGGGGGRAKTRRRDNIY